MNGENIFTKISEKDRKRLFKDLAETRGELLSKGSRDEVYRLISERTTPLDELLCSVPAYMPVPDQETELFSNFYIGGERYFFKSPVRVVNGLTHLKTNVEVFLLQRRQNYRIKIPASYPAHLQLQEHNKVQTDVKIQLIDLSCGGCKGSLDSLKPLFEVGDRISGTLNIGRRDTIDIEATLRHYKLEKTATQTRQVFGVEFKPLPPLLEGKLYAMTMDLHREFFTFGKT